MSKKHITKKPIAADRASINLESIQGYETSRGSHPLLVVLPRSLQCGNCQTPLMVNYDGTYTPLCNCPTVRIEF